jgi:glycosyltransferase involved in cell wall biosynthesis
MPFTWDRTPIAEAPLSAIVPHYQAAQVLPGVVESLVGELLKREKDYEVLLVDDGSTDGSAQAVADLQNRLPKIRALRHEKPEGYGAVLRTGLAAAQHPLIFTMPADGSYSAGDLPLLLELIDKADVVSGCRRSKSRLKRFLQRLPASKLFGVRLNDVSSHFRLYRREIFKRIPIQSKGCFADVEILAKANFLDCILSEVDITWQPPSKSVDFYRASVLGDALRVQRRPNFGPAQV